MNVKFHPGRILMTPGAMDALTEASQLPSVFIYKHITGVWDDGAMSPGDRQLNDRAVKNGERILSSYKTTNDEALWIITDACNNATQRETTTILLPSEY